MARHNPMVERKPRARKSINVAGGVAFESSPKMALYRQLATSLWAGDGYYERQEEWKARFRQNVQAAILEDPRFVLQLASYARDREGLALRAGPIALLAEAASSPLLKSTGLLRTYTPKVVLRADEPAELIAYWKSNFSGVFPAGLRRGLADKMHSFDEYQLAKYKGSKSQVKLRDVMRIVRPRPIGGEQSALWGRALAGELATPYTWEVEISRAKTQEEKRTKWNELIASKKLGLFALTRNLRNIIQAGADIEEALDQFTTERVQRSGILPFQWYKAWRAVESIGGQVSKVLEDAVLASLAGTKRIDGATLVACDNSRSMSSASQTRGLSNADIGNVLGAMALALSENAIAGTFGDHFDIARTSPRNGLFQNKHAIDACGATTGHSTNAWKIFEWLQENRVKVDRIVLLSDMQCYDSYLPGGDGRRITPMYSSFYGGRSLSQELEKYRQTVNPDVVVYSIDLGSNDNTAQFAPDQPVVELAGWSDSIFEFMGAIEEGQDDLDLIAQRY